jgi:LacI family transcriptional regulator
MTASSMQNTIQKPTTLKDIARHVGVSVNAVSTVLNETRSSASVSMATRERIRKAAEDLRYSPNVMARGLKSMRLKSIGVSYHSSPPDYIVTDHYCSSVLRGILNAANDAGYNVTHFHRPWRDARESASSFRAQGIDGFLLVQPWAGSDMVSGLSALGIPLVVISTSSDVHNVPSVDVDNDKVTRLALGHLLGLGHRRIAHLYLDGRHASFDSATRREIFLKAMAEAGLSVPPQYLQSVTGEYEEDCIAAAAALFALPEPPTALFATNDWLARRTIEAACALGIRVPEQFSVVGVDNNPLAAWPPTLTTIRQPIVEMAAEATRMLIALTEGRHIPAQTHWFDPELIVRESTAPLRQ